MGQYSKYGAAVADACHKYACELNVPIDRDNPLKNDGVFFEE